MITMIIKMASVTMAIVLVSALIWVVINDTKLKIRGKIIIGLVYATLAILSTHLGVDYVSMRLNVRDLGPLIAGIFFDPISGIIAGLIGGIERYIVGTYFNVGSYTTVACSVSTCLAGIFAAGISRYTRKGRRLALTLAFSIGAVMEVFHMYAILITHRDDMRMAFKVVDACSLPMITFTAIGMAITTMLLAIYIDGHEKYFAKRKKEETPVANVFQQRLFVIILALTLVNGIGSYAIQTESAYQNAISILNQGEENIRLHYNSTRIVSTKVTVGNNGVFCIYSDSDGKIKQGVQKGEFFSENEILHLRANIDKEYFKYQYFGIDSLCRVTRLDRSDVLLIILPTEEIFWFRNIGMYESGFSAVLLFTVVYVLITSLVNFIVVSKLERVNTSLEKITNGDLDEVVDVRDSSEFVKLSNSINETVGTLKEYIAAEKKRNEQELEVAKNIQLSALPTKFNFDSRDEFTLYAIMDAAKEVGGDFYDFYLADINKLVLVIADVSGKGIPGALFMMRAKTAIRSTRSSTLSASEILFNVNNALCEGNATDMFVTTWIGILDLKDGTLSCANCGHEFPILMRKDGEYEIYKDNHSLPLAALENTRAKEYVIKMNPGDHIFVYTDGVPEAINKSNEQYGIERLLKVLNDNKGIEPCEMLKKVRENVAYFANGADQFDDITLLECAFNRYSEK